MIEQNDPVHDTGNRRMDDSTHVLKVLIDLVLYRLLACFIDRLLASIHRSVACFIDRLLASIHRSVACFIDRFLASIHRSVACFNSSIGCFIDWLLVHQRESPKFWMNFFGGTRFMYWALWLQSCRQIGNVWEMYALKKKKIAVVVAHRDWACAHAYTRPTTRHVTRSVRWDWSFG